ncbi:MAG: hypothetical protein SPJ45_04560 [Anaerovoracaceae bacterium]|nr:hypothetical protein [Anaerovoracaceae bacterium]
MKSATSYFKVSFSVIKDDFRRFWAVPLIGFMFYFFSSIFVILMYMRDTGVNGYGNDMLAGFVDNLLDGGYIVNMLNIIWMSVLSVLLVFRYIHNSGHVIAVHSQPFTRATLLNSHTVSCVLLIALPIVLTGIILLIIAHPVYYNSEYYSSAREMADLFARVSVLRWMWESFLTAMFIMAVSIVAGMVTGTSFHHAIAALGFNAVAPVCTGLLTEYFSTYLFGYVHPDWIGKAITHMSPALNVSEGGFLSASENVYYIVLVILIYALAMFLYKKRKLERASEGIVFKAVDVLVTLIFGYLGMTALGLTFNSVFEGSKAATTIGYIAGAILGMLIVRMVIMKTVRVFNKKSVMIMGGYLVIALMFFAGLNFNVTGYETHIEEDADAIRVSMPYTVNNLMIDSVIVEDDDAKAAAMDLHRFIIKNKALIKEVKEANNDRNDYDGYEIGGYEDMVYVSFNYLKGSGEDRKTVESRSYDVPAYLILNSDEMKALVGTGVFSKYAVDQLPASEDVEYINIASGAQDSDTPYGTSLMERSLMCSDAAQVKGLMAAVEKDMHEMTYEDIKNNYKMPSIGVLEVTYNVKAGAEPEESDEENIQPISEITSSAVPSAKKRIIGSEEYRITLNRAYINTLAWLEANGYGAAIQYDPSYWSFAVVCDIENGSAVSEDAPQSYSLNEVPQKAEGVNVITDPATIKALYEGASSHMAIGPMTDMNTAGNNVYMVRFYHRTTADTDGYYENFRAYVDGSYYNELTEANEP